MFATFLHIAHVRDPCPQTLSSELSSPWVEDNSLIQCVANIIEDHVMKIPTSN